MKVKWRITRYSIRDQPKVFEGRMDQLLDYVRGYSFGGMTYPKGGLFGPILRPYLSLIVVEEGACWLRADGKSVKVTAGHTGIAVARDCFEFDYHRGVSTIVSWCEGFLPDLPEASFTEANDTLKPIATPASISQLQSIGLGTGHDSRPDLNAMRDAVGRAVVKTYLYEVRKHIEDLSIPTSVLRARRYIEESLGDEYMDIQAIALNSAVTPQHLINSFKKFLGTTPSRYLWRLRAYKARHLLIHTQLSLSQVAYNCGFRSQPHFSRSIKSNFGMTPTVLRQDMGYTQSSSSDASVRDLLY